MSSGRRWRQWAQVAVATAGLAAVLWAVAFGANPTIWCRDQAMRPGGVCRNADGTQVQTYEQRAGAAQWARPVVGVLGGGVAVFAVALWRGERRRTAAR